MQFDAYLTPDSQESRPAIEIEGGLTYNADRLCIEGNYSDELSQHRARKTWCTILETDFLLIPEADFQFTMEKDLEQNQFQIACAFKSACGRYAFWRLINEQVPEVQFLLETAHLSHRFKDYTSIIEQMEHGPQQRGEKLLNSIRKLLNSTANLLKQIAFPR